MHEDQVTILEFAEGKIGQTPFGELRGDQARPPGPEVDLDGILPGSRRSWRKGGSSEETADAPEARTDKDAPRNA